VTIVIAEGFLSTLSASIAACNSMRWLVVSFSPPHNSFSCFPARNQTPQPPGPGFPEHAPSV